jgi:hypothetical protein
MRSPHYPIGVALVAEAAAEPPPETVTVLITVPAVAAGSTPRVIVIEGRLAPGAATALVVHTSVATSQDQPLPFIEN